MVCSGIALEILWAGLLLLVEFCRFSFWHLAGLFVGPQACLLLLLSCSSRFCWCLWLDLLVMCSTVPGVLEFLSWNSSGELWSGESDGELGLCPLLCGSLFYKCVACAVASTCACNGVCPACLLTSWRYFGVPSLAAGLGIIHGLQFFLLAKWIKCKASDVVLRLG